MKRFILCLFLFALPLAAQPNNPSVVAVPSTPSACNTLPLKVVTGTPNLYGTNGSGGCTAIGGSGSGAAFDVSSYGAKSDGTTDNKTAFAAAFAASNAVTAGIPTILFPCQSGSQCQYNFSGSGVSSINPLIPSTIQCAPGVTLNYTGSAHAADIGPVGLTSSTYVSQPYRVTGCRFIDAGSATHIIYVNQYVTMIEVDQNMFYNTPLSASSTAWPIYLAGFNWDSSIHNNRFAADTNTTINEGVFVYPADGNSQLRFTSNELVCVNGIHGVSGCTTSGSGPVVSGWGSSISGNNIAFLQPDLRILGPTDASTDTHYIGSDVKITDNYFESSPSSTVPIIQYGDPSDIGGTNVTGLIITNNSFDTQQTAAPFMGPDSSNVLLTSTLIDGLHGLNVIPTNVLVVENNLTSQQNNEVRNVSASSGIIPPALPLYNIHTIATNVLSWLYLDHGSYSDGFVTNGALPAPWVNVSGSGIGGPLTVSSNIVTCVSATCESSYSYDPAPNMTVGVTVSTVPTTPGDEFFAYTRMNSATANANLYGYQCAYVAGTGFQIYKVAAGSFTQLGTTYSTTAPLAGDQLIMQSVGALHTCSLQHSTGLIKMIGPINDFDYPSGYAGMGLNGSTGAISSFAVQSQP